MNDDFYLVRSFFYRLQWGITSGVFVLVVASSWMLTPIFESTLGVLSFVCLLGVLSDKGLRKKFGLSLILSCALLLTHAVVRFQIDQNLFRDEMQAFYFMLGYLLFGLNFFVALTWREIRGFKLRCYRVSRLVANLFWVFVVLSFIQASLGSIASTHLIDFPGMGIEKLHRTGAYILVGLALIFKIGIHRTAELSLRTVASFGLFLIILQMLWGVTSLFSLTQPIYRVFHAINSLVVFGIYFYGAFRARSAR